MNSLSYGGPEVAPRERSVPRCPLRTFPRDCSVRQIIYGGAYVTGTQQLGGSGGKILEFRGYEVASETIFGQNNASRPEARRQSFTCMNINPFCTLRLSDRSLISQATPFADRLDCWNTRSFALFAAISYYVATCHHAVCVPWAFAEHWPYLATPSKPWVREKVVRLKPD